MKRVEANQQWSLFCPNEAPGLHEVWGEEFERKYEEYERSGRARKTIDAQKLWYAILEAQIETGGPFMCYKDHANGKFLILFLGRAYIDVFHSKIKPAKPWDHQVIELVHRDYRVFFP